MSTITPRPKAWHKDSKVMMAVAAHLYTEGKLIVDWDGKKNYKAIPLDQFDLLQPTGFYDTAGSMKYVGDITAGPYVTHVIVFNEKTGAFAGKSLGGAFYAMNDNSMAESKIVGNIYQNKELLKR